MPSVTADSGALREAISAHRSAIQDVLHRYGAHNPRVFGSVARGDADAASDLNILVELEPGRGNDLLRIAGIGEELTELLGIKVEIVTPSLLKEPVSITALADAISL